MTNTQYQTIEKAIRYINENFKTQPGLEEIAHAINMSPSHFQRLFRQWAGITPKRLLQYLTVHYAKQRLKDSSVLDVSLKTGLSSQSRLYDHFITLEAVTPGQFKNQGSDMIIKYGTSNSPFGYVFIAATERGICNLSFVSDNRNHDPLTSLRNTWPNATLQKKNAHIHTLSKKIFNSETKSKEKFHLLIQGSNFQIKVWESLLRIPDSMVFSYQQVASSMAMPSASRAVANAIGKNPVSYLIPCHRVIRSTGVIGGYRWGCERKQAMIAWEAAKAHSSRRENL